VALFAGLHKGVRKNGNIRDRVLRNAQFNAARNTRVPGIGSIDADNQRAGATDRLARLIRPLWAEKTQRYQWAARFSEPRIGAKMTESISSKSILHFVGFPDNHGRRFTGAVRLFGPPAFMHRFWDQRAVRDIAPTA
jgi:hypothetical protein